MGSVLATEEGSRLSKDSTTAGKKESGGKRQPGSLSLSSYVSCSGGKALGIIRSEVAFIYLRWGTALRLGLSLCNVKELRSAKYLRTSTIWNGVTF